MMKILFLSVAIALVPMLAVAEDGRASGTIDERAVDIPLDCSQWEDGSEATARAADGSEFEAVRLGYNDSLAIIWVTEEKRYQLMFGDVPFATTVTASTEFSNRATGETFMAEITIDCAG